MPRSTHIGAYRILRLINQGGQGTVYLGFDDRLHRRVAIKIVRLPRDKSSRRDILREAQLLASIQSSKIVQVYDLVAANDHVALIMEYVPGCDLEEFLEHTRPSLASILTICIDIAAALAVARQQHIVHGDLKASNILITQQGRVKLTDFGIARNGKSADSNPSSPASIACVSPEQYLGSPLDVRSDLFALGCLMYRMLTGKHPFICGGELNPEMLLRSDPQAAEELVSKSMLLPPNLSMLLSALLQKRPENRPVNTHQVRSALRKISREIPISVENTLLHEAESFFRPESQEDIAPVIPSDLTRSGRSQLRQLSFIREFLVTRPYAALAGILLSVVIGSIFIRSFFKDDLHIVIENPNFVIATAADLPSELSPQWVAQEIKRVLRLQLDSVAVFGREPQTAFISQDLIVRSDVQLPKTDLLLRPKLHCVDDLCLLDLVLEKAGEEFTQQKLIFASMPISQWSNMVQSATQALLDQSR